MYSRFEIFEIENQKSKNKLSKMAYSTLDWTKKYVPKLITFKKFAHVSETKLRLINVTFFTGLEEFGVKTYPIAKSGPDGHRNACKPQGQCRLSSLSY